MHPYMTEQLAVLHQRQLLEDAAKARLARSRPSWLRRRLSALRQSRDRRPALRRAPVGHLRPAQRVEDPATAG
jgi:hypothetical protein